MGLGENSGRDGGIDEPYWGPSMNKHREEQEKKDNRVQEKTDWQPSNFYIVYFEEKTKTHE